MAAAGVGRGFRGGAMRIGTLRRAHLVARTIAVGVLLLGLAAPTSSSARTTSEQPASIIVFPKVIVDGTRDTFIQISNTANSMVHAHCIYINAFPTCEGIGDCQMGTCSGPCVPQWQELDFNIWLTKQQPTHWGAGFGRRDSVGAQSCFRDLSTGERQYDCYSAGLAQGLIPPVPTPFEGELRCIEVDQSGAPISGNHLKGEATLISRDGDASKYNAIGILGEPFTNNGDNTLCLGGEPSEDCPTGAEYEGCAARFWIPHFAAGADNPILGPTSKVRTEITVVPCRVNYERGALDITTVTLQFRAVNEFEQGFSASHRVDCWDSFFLDDVNQIFSANIIQSRLVQTMMRPSSSSPSSVIAVVEEFHALSDEGLTEDGRVVHAAFNVHETGEFDGEPVFGSELITIPAGP